MTTLHAPSTIPVTAPFDGHTIGEVPATDSAGVARAVARAREALAAVHNGEFPAWKRAARVRSSCSAATAASNTVTPRGGC